MNKQKILKLINLLLILDWLVVVLSILFYRFIPSALQGSIILYETHWIGGIIFILLTIIHFSLNFKWVKSTYFKHRKEKK